MSELQIKERNFSFIGTVKINDYTYAIDKKSSNNKDWIYSQIGLMIDCGNGNTPYVKAMGGYNPKGQDLYVHGVNKDDKNRDDYSNKFTIPWGDRFDKDVLATIGQGCFLTAGLEKNDDGSTKYKKFLSEYDFIAYVKEHLKNDMKVSITGDLEYQYYQGNTSKQHTIKKIILANEDAEPRAKFRQRFLLDENAIGDEDTENNIIPITGYVVQYISKYKGQVIKKKVSLPQTFYFPTDKFGDNTQKIVKKLFKASGNKVINLGVEGIIFQGAETSVSSIDDVPADIKEHVELGLLTEEEAIAKCTTGQRENKMVFEKVTTSKVKNENDEYIPTMNYDDTTFKFDDLVFITSLIKEDEQSKSTPNLKDVIEDDEELANIMSQLTADSDGDE